MLRIQPDRLQQARWEAGAARLTNGKTGTGCECLAKVTSSLQRRSPAGWPGDESRCSGVKSQRKGGLDGLQAAREVSCSAEIA
jgi:hypothetical protein